MVGRFFKIKTNIKLVKIRIKIKVKEIKLKIQIIVAYTGMSYHPREV